MDAATLRATIPIPAVLRRHGIDWPDDRRRGPCPFHHGTNPTALSLRTDGRVGCCYACGWKGSAIDAEMALGPCTVSEAIRSLSEGFPGTGRRLPVSDTATDQLRALRDRIERNARILAALDRASTATRTHHWVGQRLAAYRRSGNAFGIAHLTARLDETATEELRAALALEELEWTRR